jgi:hypothetical protein
LPVPYWTCAVTAASCRLVKVPTSRVYAGTERPPAATLMGQEPQTSVGAHALFHPECWTHAAPEVWQRVDQKVRAEDVVEEI